MLKKVAPNGRHAQFSFNGERVTASRLDGYVTLYNGSSLNRKNNDERKEARKAAEATAQGLFPAADVSGRKSLSAFLCDVEKDMSGDQRPAVQSCKRKINRVHMLSPRSKGKVREKCQAFFRVYGRSCTFVTLSFITCVPDKAAVVILNKFLTALRKEFGGETVNFLWVAERQTSNTKFPDNIHFHLLIDRRLEIIRFNSLWVLQQYNSGLRGYSRIEKRVVPADQIEYMYKNTMRLLRLYRSEADQRKKEQLLKEIEETKIGKLFNPFDIKKVYSVDGLAQYLTAYISKNKGKFQCSAWRCSRGVSRTFTKRAVGLELFQACDSQKNTVVNKKTGELIKGKTFVCEHAVIKYIVNKKWAAQFLADVDQINSWILKEGFIPDIITLSEQEYLSRIHNEQLN